MGPSFEWDSNNLVVERIYTPTCPQDQRRRAKVYISQPFTANGNPSMDLQEKCLSGSLENTEPTNQPTNLRSPRDITGAGAVSLTCTCMLSASGLWPRRKVLVVYYILWRGSSTFAFSYDWPPLIKFDDKQKILKKYSIPPGIVIFLLYGTTNMEYRSF